MAEDFSIQVISTLEFLCDRVFGVFGALLTQDRFMQGWIEELPNHLHPGDTLLLQHFHQLLVETLITPMQCLGFFSFRVELLPSPLDSACRKHDAQEIAPVQVV